MKKVKRKSGLQSIRGHHFYATLIDANSIVVDLGAHTGQFSSEISNTFGCRCYAVEALPALCEKIIETHLVKKFNYAISGDEGLVNFRVTDNQESNHIDKSSISNGNDIITVEGISLEKFIDANKIQFIDLLKVDIEGAEIDVFNSTSDNVFRRAKQITIEFHDFIKELKCSREVETIKSRLQSLGFACMVFSRSNNGDVLFINKAKINISAVEMIYLQYIAKYLRGLFRIAIRLLKNR